MRESEMKGRRLFCVYCRGHGIVQCRNVYDPSPEECDWCAGNGFQWKYPNGTIAAYYGGPLRGREQPDPAPCGDDE